MNKGDRPGVGEAEPGQSPDQLVNSFPYATTWVKIKNLTWLEGRSPPTDFTPSS
jgi:hypothetical protein